MGVFIMNMSLLMAFSIVLLTLVVGELVSTKTKAFVPSVFVTAILFLIGFWTFFPKNITEIAGFTSPIVTLSMLLLVTHLGTMMSIKELASQWKTIVIGLVGIVGICAGTLTLGTLLFGWDAVVIATPPLTGGVVASIMMADIANAKGLSDLAVLAVLMYVMQGFAGYPLTSIMLRREGKRLLGVYKKETLNGSQIAKAEMAVTQENSRFRIFPPVPKKYQSAYVLLLQLGLLAWAAVGLETLTAGKVSKYVFCLIVGVIGAEIGFVERKALNQANSFGFLMTGLMAFIFSSLGKATPKMLLELSGPLFGIIIIGITGMAILSIIIGKLLGESKEMSFAIALTALYGFPANYILTEEASKGLTDNDEEKQYLMDAMLPKMLVGGFTTVTIVSVLIAGVFVQFI
jgi:hypothetical protein